MNHPNCRCVVAWPEEKPTFDVGDRVKLKCPAEEWARSRVYPVGTKGVVERYLGPDFEMPYVIRFDDGRAWCWSQKRLEEYFAKAVKIDEAS